MSCLCQVRDFCVIKAELGIYDYISWHKYDIFNNCVKLFYLKTNTIIKWVYMKNLNNGKSNILKLYLEWPEM